MKQKIDKYWIGILLGIALPALFGWLYMDQMHLTYLLTSMTSQMGVVMSKVLLVSIFPDLALIFLFYEMDVWRLAKGVLIGTFPYLLGCIICQI